MNDENKCVEEGPLYSPEGSELQRAQQEIEWLNEHIAKLTEKLNDRQQNVKSGETYEQSANWSQYLLMLFESQKVGHDVHNEIDEALGELKHALGLGE